MNGEDGQLLRGLMGAAAEGLVLGSLFFMIPAILQGAGGAFGKMVGNLNNKNRGPLDRLKKLGNEQAEYIGNKQRGRMLAKTDRRWGFKRDNDGKIVKGENGLPILEKDQEGYRRMGYFTRRAAQRQRVLEGTKYEAGRIAAITMAEQIESDDKLKARVGGASMYGTADDRTAATTRASARATEEASKFYGENKKAGLSLMLDNNVDVGKLLTLAKGTAIKHNGVEYGKDLQAAAASYFFDRKMAAEIDDIVTNGRFEDRSARASIMYDWNQAYQGLKETGHHLNNMSVKQEFMRDGQVSQAAINAATADIGGIGTDKLISQKADVLTRVARNVEQEAIPETAIKSLQAEAQQAINNQNIYSRLSTDVQINLHRIVKGSSDINILPSALQPIATEMDLKNAEKEAKRAAERAARQSAAAA